MKILHITPSYYPAFKYGGPIESVHLLNRALVKQEISVDVLTTDSGLKDRNDIVLNEWIYHNGVHVKYVRCYFNERYAFSPLVLNILLSQVKNYDLVHLTALWSFPVLAGANVCLLYKKPYLISPRGMLYYDALNIKSKNLKMLYYELFAKSILNKASAWHFTTIHEKNNIAPIVSHSVSNKKSTIIPNGINLNDYKSLPAKDTFKKKYPILACNKYILFLSRLNKQKGLDILIDAFHKLLNTDDKLYLVLAGPDDGYEMATKDILRSYKILNKAIFTGILKGEDKLAAYVDAELFVLPSYFENFGMSIIEAMACNTPVVISDRVGIANDIEDARAGAVVDLDVESLYLAIKNLLENPNLKQLYSNNGIRLIREKYNIEQVSKLMIKAYEKVLEG